MGVVCVTDHGTSQVSVCGPDRRLKTRAEVDLVGCPPRADIQGGDRESSLAVGSPRDREGLRREPMRFGGTVVDEIRVSIFSSHNDRVWVGGLCRPVGWVPRQVAAPDRELSAASALKGLIELLQCQR